METHNIVSTPNITGNIGSCSTSVEKQIITSGFWNDSGYTIATNSCTGEVKTFDYNSVNGLLIVTIGVLAFSFLLIVIAIASERSY